MILTGKHYSVKLAPDDAANQALRDKHGRDMKGGGDSNLASASIALPGRKLATSSKPRMLKPFEIDLLQQDLKAALSIAGHAKSDDEPGRVNGIAKLR